MLAMFRETAMDYFLLVDRLFSHKKIEKQREYRNDYDAFAHDKYVYSCNAQVVTNF